MSEQEAKQIVLAKYPDAYYCSAPIDAIQRMYWIQVDSLPDPDITENLKYCYGLQSAWISAANNIINEQNKSI